MMMIQCFVYRLLNCSETLFRIAVTWINIVSGSCWLTEKNDPQLNIINGHPISDLIAQLLDKVYNGYPE